MRRLVSHIAIATAMLAGSSLAGAATVSSGVADITGTWAYDFDAGVQGDFLADATQDIWWRQMTATTRQIEATNGAQIVNLGTVSFASITAASLQSLTYGVTPISGSNVGNQLTFGDVFAVKTTSGNYAKVLVSAPFFDPGNNNGLIVYYETFAPAVPEPGSVGLALAGLGVVGWLGRRKQRA